MNLAFLGNSGSIQGAMGGNTSLCVKHNDLLVLIDASGSPVECLTRVGFDPMNVDLVLLSHAHIDHIYALPSLIHNLWLMGREDSLEIAANAPTLKKAKQLIEFFGLPEKKNMFDVQFTELNEGVIKRDSLVIESFPVIHGIETNGFTFFDGRSKLTYMADCNNLTVIPACAKGSAVMVHEACLGNKADHSSGLDAGLCAMEAGASKLYLVHLPQNLSQRQRILSDAKAVFPETEIPEIMKQVEV